MDRKTATSTSIVTVRSRPAAPTPHKLGHVSAKAGWYPDPGGGQSLFRYWDGKAWSAATSPNPKSPPPTQGVIGDQPTSADRRPSWPPGQGGYGTGYGTGGFGAGGYGQTGPAGQAGVEGYGQQGTAYANYQAIQKKKSPDRVVDRRRRARGRDHRHRGCSRSAPSAATSGSPTTQQRPRLTGHLPAREARDGRPECASQRRPGARRPDLLPRARLPLGPAEGRHPRAVRQRRADPDDDRREQLPPGQNWVASGARRRASGRRRFLQPGAGLGDRGSSASWASSTATTRSRVTSRSTRRPRSTATRPGSSSHSSASTSTGSRPRASC